MINQEGVIQFLEDLNIPEGAQQRFQDVATMCGILPDELMVRLVMRLCDRSEEVMRDLVDPTYEWDGD